MRLTERERLILVGAEKYCLAETGGEYYQLGGNGCVPVRYNLATLPKLARRGLVSRDQGVWRITEKGSAALISQTESSK
jgi:hypothetical protein